MEEYWGITYDNKGERQFGLQLQGSIRMYMDTGQKVSVEKILPFLDPDKGLEGVKLTEDGKYIDEASVLGFRMDSDNLPIYRLFSTESVKSGLPRDSVWQLGYPKIVNYNEANGKITYDIIPQVVITHDNGHILRNENGLHMANYFVTKHGIAQLVDYGQKWSSPSKNLGETWFEGNILEDYRGVKYGFKTIFYEVNRHGNSYLIQGRELDLTTMKLKFNLDREYNKDRFKDDSYAKRERSEKTLLESFSFLRKYPVPDNIMRKATELAESVLKPIYDLAKIQAEFKASVTKSYQKLNIGDKILKILNSYVDKNGLTQEGPGYEEIIFLFKELIGGDRWKDISFQSYYNKRLIFDTALNDKSWINNILNALQAYESPESISSSKLKELDGKIVEWKTKFFNKDDSPRTFSSGEKFQTYGKFEDIRLVKDLLLAINDLFGRYTISKMRTGSVLFSDSSFDFIAYSWPNFVKAYKHNSRLFLPHYTATSGGGPPTGLASLGGKIGFVVDSIIFGPTWRLAVIDELGANPKDILLRTPHIPTYNWNPAYITDREVAEVNINRYTSELSAWLSKFFDYKINVRNLVIKESKTLVTRRLLEEVFEIHNEKVKDYEGRNKDYYSTLVLGKLYQLFLLEKGQGALSKRKSIIQFLQGDLKEYNIQLFGEEVPKDFRSISLVPSHLAYWKSRNLDKDFLKSFRVSPTDIDVISVLNNLKEPISEFGRLLKNTADKYGNPAPTHGNPKKLYLIPLRTYTSGLGQGMGSSHQDSYTQMTNSKIIIDGLEWDCWELDGSSEAELREFGNIYDSVLRGLLEGGLHFFVWTQDMVSGEIESIGNFGILGGALNIDQLFFSSQGHHRTFSSISAYDEVFHNEIGSIMNLFRRYQLPLTPKTKDSLNYYNFIF